jgi:hypothetical protein
VRERKIPLKLVLEPIFEAHLEPVSEFGRSRPPLAGVGSLQVEDVE